MKKAWCQASGYSSVFPLVHWRWGFGGRKDIGPMKTTDPWRLDRWTLNVSSISSSNRDEHWLLMLQALLGDEEGRWRYSIDYSGTVLITQLSTLYVISCRKAKLNNWCLVSESRCANELKTLRWLQLTIIIISLMAQPHCLWLSVSVPVRTFFSIGKISLVYTCGWYVFSLY